MKEILIVRADDDNYHITVNGNNIDLLSAMALVIKDMEKKSDISVEQALKYITSYLKEEKNNE